MPNLARVGDGVGTGAPKIQTNCQNRGISASGAPKREGQIERERLEIGR